MSSPAPKRLLGLDFSCAPSRRKPLTLAWGQRAGQVIRLERVDELPTLAALEAVLAPHASARQPRPVEGAGDAVSEGFVMGCDFPFGLPRAFVEALLAHGPAPLREGLLGQAHTTPAARAAPSREASQAGASLTAERLIRALHQHCVDRAGFQHLIDTWGQSWHTTRTTGSKLLHRVTDRALPGLTSTSPLQTRYVPVGKMYFEGMHRLVAANLSLPGLHQGRPNAVALEAYPGLLAGEILGRRSYKSDAQPTPDRLIARMDLVDALEQGRTRLGLRLKLSPALRDQLVADPKGDHLDAALCLMQAGWAHWQAEQGAHNWGLPADLDPIEGWILTA